MDFLPGDDLPAVSTRRSRGGGGSRLAERVDRVAVDTIERITERIRLLEEERAAIGLTEREQTRLNASFEKARIVRELETAAAREGITITPEQRAQIEALAAEYARLTLAVYDQQAAQERLAEAQREAEEAAEAQGKAIEDLGDRFTDAIQQADSFADALKNVALELANLIAQALAGQGPLSDLFGGNIFSSIFRPQAGINVSSLSFAPGADPRFFHAGGVVGRGGGRPAHGFLPEQWIGAPRLHGGGAIFGPNEVPAILERGEIVVPKDIGMGRQMPNVDARMSVVIDSPGASADEIMARLEPRLQRHQRDTLKATTQMWRNAPNAFEGSI